MWSNASLYSDAYLQTSFSGFYINSIANTVVAFSFGLSTSLLPNPAYDINVSFDVIIIDTHNGWNKLTNRYTIPLAGIYVVSFGIAAAANKNPYVSVVVNNIFVAALYFGAVTDGTEMTSRTIVVNLKRADQLSATLSKNAASVYSDLQYQTNLKGFLYNPQQLAPISWCVVSVFSVTIYITGLVDPINFNTIFVNQGSGWDNVTNRFLTPLPGVYYVQLTAGLKITQSTKIELLVNGILIINVYRQFSASPSSYDARSRAAILHLKQTDELRVRLPDSYWLVCDINKYTTFAGFRLYA